MVVKLVKMKNRSYYFWNDAIFFKDFDPKFVKIDKKEPQPNIGIHMFFIGYIVKKPEYNIDNVNALYLVIKSLEGYIEKINGSNDRNLVVTSDLNKSRFNILWKNIEDKVSDLLKKDNSRIKFGSEGETVSIVDKYKIRFDSDTSLPLDTPPEILTIRSFTH